MLAHDQLFGLKIYIYIQIYSNAIYIAFVQQFQPMNKFVKIAIFACDSQTAKEVKIVNKPFTIMELHTITKSFDISYMEKPCCKIELSFFPFCLFIPLSVQLKILKS